MVGGAQAVEPHGEAGVAEDFRVEEFDDGNARGTIEAVDGPIEVGIEGWLGGANVGLVWVTGEEKFAVGANAGDKEADLTAS